jgi:hypothetical protein
MVERLKENAKREFDRGDGGGGYSRREDNNEEDDDRPVGQTSYLQLDKSQLRASCANSHTLLLSVLNSFFFFAHTDLRNSKKILSEKEL